MQCLHELNYKKLKNLVENILHITNWSIRKDKIENRTDNITFSDRFLLLKKKAQQKKIQFNDIEIVTWIDTLRILYNTFNKMENEELKNSISILQEYKIPYSQKRTDYLLILNNQILILEFSFNKLNYELQYETKLQQAIGYKELLSNLLPKEIDIGTYTFMVEAEEEKNGTAIYFQDTEFFPNFFKGLDLAKFIEKFFSKNKNYAFKELERIEGANI